jgi:cell division septal protein FtsQ
VARASVRKFYPNTLTVQIEERTPFALWQQDGQVRVIDDTGTEIVPLEDARFAKLPFMVGEGANDKARSSSLKSSPSRRSSPSCAPPCSSPAVVGTSIWTTVSR